MEPLLNKKRPVSLFIPYRKVGNNFEFYLQRRDINAPVHAGIFSMFGGGIEDDENILDAFKRETLEELEYTPTKAEYFCKFETSRGIFHVFVENVGADFKSKVKVNEGEYGAFLKIEKIRYSSDVSLAAQLIINDLIHYLDPNRNVYL